MQLFQLLARPNGNLPRGDVTGPVKTHFTRKSQAGSGYIDDVNMEGHILSDVCHSAEFQRLLSSGNGVRDPLSMIQPVLLVNDHNSFQPWPCVASEATICFRFEAFEYKFEREYAQCVN